jgi:hypothetical protein
MTGSNSQQNVSPVCPECGAENYRGAVKCHICWHDFTAEESAALPPQTTPTLVASRKIEAPVPAPKTYSLSSLFLGVTLLCILIGLGPVAPGLAILLGGIIAIVLAERYRRRNPPSAKQYTEQELERMRHRYPLIIFVVIPLVVIATIIAFFIACTAIMGPMRFN